MRSAANANVAVHPIGETARVRRAEQFVRNHLSPSTVIGETVLRDGNHVTVGRERPLAPDFVPSGGDTER